MKLEFCPEKQTLLLKLKEVSIPKILFEFAEKNELIKKDEFHITLVGNQTGEEIKSIADDIDKNKLLTIAKDINWDFKLLDNYYYMQKEYENHIRNSIIQPIELEGLNYFYQLIEKYYDKKFDVPYPHITYFAKGDKNQGIGIYSEKDFFKYKKNKI